MRAEEITRAVGTDIREENGIVLVDVLGAGGRRARTVPLRRPWDREVLALATESGKRPYFRPDRTGIRRNDVLGFVRRCSADGPPKFNLQRLRVTWIVEHLTSGVQLTALEEAAGVAAGQLVKYLKFATPLDEAEARLVLAGKRGDG